MGHVQVVIDLLDRGANTEGTTTLDSTPLHFACGNGYLAVVIELLGPNDRSDSATTSILGKRTNHGGANTEANDRHGNTPLHDASVIGHLAVVKALVTRGANILAANTNGHLPIRRAMRAGYSRVPILRGVSSRNLEVAKYLLQHFYATTRRPPLEELLKDLTWIGNPYSSRVPLLRAALHRNVLGTDDVVEIIEYLAG
jgi:hypothetical protein